MFLVRLIYVSQTTDQFKSEDIKNILSASKENNAKAGLTGILGFSHNTFLQCLEGSRKAVNALYHQILNDERHQNIILIEYAEIAQREFSKWGMGYLPDTALTSSINLKYSGNDQFTPYEMTGDSVHKMLLELCDQVEVI